MVQATGVGSIWNKGNWHWEEKNYTDFAKDFLTQKWCAISLNKADALIEVYEVKELTGSASVTIRKQKQTPMFEFEGEVYWRAKSTKPDDERSTCSGKIKIHEFNQEDDEVQTDVTCNTDSNWASAVRRVIQTEVSEKLLSEALTLVPALKAKDIDEERLAKARAEEAAAAQAYQEAQAQSGAIKQQIAEEAKKREAEMK